MDKNPYMAPGVVIAARLARDREWHRILSQVERNHLSIVGPRYIGKTVLLHALARHFQEGDGPFGQASTGISGIIRQPATSSSIRSSRRNWLPPFGRSTPSMLPNSRHGMGPHTRAS